MVDADGDAYRLPEEMETEYEFAPRMNGVAAVVAVREAKINLRLWRVNFAFGQSLRSMLATTQAPAAEAKPATSLFLARAGTEPEPGVAIDYAIVSTRLLNVNFGGGSKVG